MDLRDDEIVYLLQQVAKKNQEEKVRPLLERVAGKDKEEKFAFLIRVLLKRMASGDVKAFDVLYLGYSRLIYGPVSRKLGEKHRWATEDIVHETFLALINKPQDYDPDKGPFIAWLHGIANNKIHDHFRQYKVEEGKELTGDEMEDFPVDDPGEMVDEEKRRKSLLKCLDRLSYELRETIISAKLQEMKYEDVAMMLGVPVGTVKSRISNAIGQLEECLKKKLGKGA